MKRRKRVASLLARTLATLCPQTRTREALGRLIGSGLRPQDTWTLAAGKAATKMALAADDCGFGQGLTISYNASTGPTSFEPFVAGHPLPNDASFAAGARAKRLASSLSKDESLLCLLSGGASAMMCAPAEGLSRETFLWLHQTLLGSGAPIDILNSIRAGVSSIKSGRLRQLAAPASVFTLAISDVPTTDARWTGSAPTQLMAGPVPWTTQVLDYIDLQAAPADLRSFIESAKPISSLPASHFEVISENATAVDALREIALADGLRVHVVSEVIVGEAYVAGERFARRSSEIFRDTSADIIIGGGEPSVTRQGDGAGGRTHEFVIGALPFIGPHLVCGYGTDGVDGNSGGAGAFGDTHLLDRARRERTSFDRAREESNTGAVLAALGAQLPMAPTGHNLADLYLMLR